MDFSNLKLLQALSGINPPQQDNGLSMPPMEKSGMFSGLFQPQNIPQQNPIESPDFSGLLQHGATDQLNELLQSQPQHGDYQPGFWRKLGSGLISLEDPRLASDFRNRKYNEAMTDWGGKLKPLSELADAERAANTNIRLQKSAETKADQFDRAQTEKERAALSKEELTREKLDELWAYKALKEEMYRNPAGKIQTNGEGFLISINPVSGETKLLTDQEGKPIKSDKLPEAQRLEIQNQNRLTQIGAQGSENRRTVAAQGEKEKDVSAATLPDKIKLKTTTPGKNTTPVEKSPSSEKRVKVVHPDGRKGTVPESQLATAIKQGFKVQ